MLCSAASGLTLHGCIHHLSRNYISLILGTIKQDLFAHDLLPRDDMRYIWLLSAVLSMLSWKELCVTYCHPPQLFFAGVMGKPLGSMLNAVGLHVRRSSSKRNNVKLAQVIIQTQNHRILSIILFSSQLESEHVHHRLFYKQKSRYHKSVGCSYCKLNHIGSLSTLAPWTEF